MGDFEKLYYDGDDTVASQDWDGDGYEIFTRDENGELADPIGSTLDENYARLFAAAPDLLEACLWVVEWLGHDELESSENANVQFVKALKSCRAAIALTEAS